MILKKMSITLKIFKGSLPVDDESVVAVVVVVVVGK
jgi:hypothetical protein